MSASREQVLANYHAGLTKEVLGFFEAHRPLSNFHLEDFTWEGILWSSSEAAYQGAKWPRAKWPLLARLPPGEAKALGQQAAHWHRKQFQALGHDIMAPPDWELDPHWPNLKPEPPVHNHPQSATFPPCLPTLAPPSP